MMIMVIMIMLIMMIIDNNDGSGGDNNDDDDNVIELLTLSMRPVISHLHAVLSMLSGLVLCNMFLFFFLFITRWKQIRYNTPSTLNRRQLLVRNGTTPLQVIYVSELFALALYIRDLRTTP